MSCARISASLLSANFAKLGEDAAAMLAAGADMLHFDIMDHHYVPNLTMGPLVCRALRDYGITAPFDVHLMVKPVDTLITEFADAGATYISIHPEATEHLDRSLQLIIDSGCQAGLVFNPATPLHYLNYVMQKLDFILLMTVNPGFAAQPFIPELIDKVKETRRIVAASGYDVHVAVDGGINASNIKLLASAGADTFIMGSALFSNPDYASTLKIMRRELQA